MKNVKIFSKSQFSILWWSGTLSSFGDWATLFASVALASHLGSQQGNSEITAVVPIVARIIPAFMSSLAGLLADRLQKKNIMIFCDFVRIWVVLGLFFSTTLFQLFIINFISEIFSLMRQPARESIVPEVVNDEYLVKANSLFVVGTYASLPIASLVFGFVSDSDFIVDLVNFGNGWSGSFIFLLDAVTFSISCLLLLFLQPNKNQVFQSEERTAINDLKEGFKYFLSIYELRIVTVSISLSLVGAGALLF